MTIKPPKIVLTNGCFDLLHIGHLRYLNAARKLGDRLIVGLNSDQSVRELKGNKRPIISEAERSEMLLALSCVDEVRIFGEKSADALIRSVRPDIYIKAGDYTPSTLPEYPTLQKLGIEVVFAPFEQGHSTSNLIEKICKLYSEKT